VNQEFRSCRSSGAPNEQAREDFEKIPPLGRPPLFQSSSKGSLEVTLNVCFRVKITFHLKAMP
jgi:hypothetical protein